MFKRDFFKQIDHYLSKDREIDLTPGQIEEIKFACHEMGEGPWKSKEAFENSQEHKLVCQWLEYVFLRKLNLDELG